MKSRANDKGDHILRAERFELTDSEGNLHAALGLGPNGITPRLDFFDISAQNKLHIILSLEPVAGACLTFFKDGKQRASLVMNPDGHPALMLFDNNERPRATILVDPQQNPWIQLHDEAGNVLWRVP